MKDSKEKEHRISNLKDMIDNVSNNESVDDFEEFEEDIELINYLNEDHVDYDGDYEINDEFIYRPGDDEGNAINLDENNINEEFLIRTPKEKEVENEDSPENEDFIDDFTAEVSDGFDTIIHAKIGRTPILAVIGSFLGLLFILISAIIFSSGSDRVIDNVAQRRPSRRRPPRQIHARCSSGGCGHPNGPCRPPDARKPQRHKYFFFNESILKGFKLLFSSLMQKKLTPIFSTCNLSLSSNAIALTQKSLACNASIKDFLKPQI